MAIDERTAGAMILELARLVGDRITFGTASGGSASTLVDTTVGVSGLSRYTSNTDEDIISANVIILAGPGAGDNVLAATYDGGTKTITPLPDFSASITSSSEYLLTRRFHLQDYLEALRNAARDLRSMKPNPHVKEAVDRSIITGSPFQNGTFYLWSGGAAVVPDGWTLSGTNAAVAQESNAKYGGLFSAKVTSNTTNDANLRQSVAAGIFKGMSIAPKVFVLADKASRASLTVAMIDEGGADIATAQAVAGDVNWNALEPTALTVGDDAATIELRLDISADAGGAVVAYWAMARQILTPQFAQEYAIPTGPTYYAFEPELTLNKVIGNTDGAELDTFDSVIPSGQWDILKESTRKLRLPATTPTDRILTIRGWAYHADLASVATIWTGESETLVALAAARLNGLGAKTEDDRRIARDELTDARRRAVESAPELPFGWLKVESN